MAYMSQENKAEKAPVIKSILKKYGLKGSLGVRNHSTLVLNISEGPINFYENMIETAKEQNAEIKYISEDIQVNPYWYKKDFSGVALEAMSELVEAMNASNWDESDIQTDYFNVGWYIDINIGKYNKPYKLIA
jgi:hypothetical protein